MEIWDAQKYNHNNTTGSSTLPSNAPSNNNNTTSQLVKYDDNALIHLLRLMHIMQFDKPLTIYIIGRKIKRADLKVQIIALVLVGFGALVSFITQNEF